MIKSIIWFYKMKCHLNHWTVMKNGFSEDTLVNWILTYKTICNIDFKSDYALDYIRKMENDIKNGYYEIQFNNIPDLVNNWAS